jgi:multidrug resistance efflux pump
MDEAKVVPTPKAIPDPAPKKINIDLLEAAVKTAKLHVEKAKLGLATAKENLTQLKMMAERGIVPISEVNAANRNQTVAELDLRIAEVELQLAESKLKEAQLPGELAPAGKPGR